MSTSNGLMSFLAWLLPAFLLTTPPTSLLFYSSLFSSSTTPSPTPPPLCPSAPPPPGAPDNCIWAGSRVAGNLCWDWGTGHMGPLTCMTRPMAASYPYNAWHSSQLRQFRLQRISRGAVTVAISQLCLWFTCCKNKNRGQSASER
jgi:hypothetical protein